MIRYLMVIACALLLTACEKDNLVGEIESAQSTETAQELLDKETEQKPPLSEEAIQQLNGQPITDLIQRLHESEQKISSRHLAREQGVEGASFHSLVEPLPARDIIVQSEWDRIDFNMRPSIQTGMSTPLQYVLMHRLAHWILQQKNVMARMDSPDERLNGTDGSLLEHSEQEGMQY